MQMKRPSPTYELQPQNQISLLILIKFSKQRLKLLQMKRNKQPVEDNNNIAINEIELVMIEEKKSSPNIIEEQSIELISNKNPIQNVENVMQHDNNNLEVEIQKENIQCDQEKLNSGDFEEDASFNSTTSVVLNWDVKENKTITECDNESASEVKPKQHDNCESDQEEIMLSAKELLSKTTHLRDPSFGINQKPNEKYNQLQKIIDDKQYEIDSLKSYINTLENRISDLEQDLNQDRIFKRYSALLKVFDQCQIAWRNENENLRSLIFTDCIDQNADIKSSPAILPLQNVKNIIEETIREQEVRQNNYETIKESAYSSLTFSLTGGIKLKNVTNNSSINCISEINEENHESGDTNKHENNDCLTPLKEKDDQNIMNISQNKNYDSNNEKQIELLNKSNILNTPKTPKQIKANFDACTSPIEKSRNSVCQLNSQSTNTQRLINSKNDERKQMETEMIINYQSVSSKVEQINSDALTKLVNSPKSIKNILSQNDENIISMSHDSPVEETPVKFMQNEFRSLNQIPAHERRKSSDYNFEFRHYEEPNENNLVKQQIDYSESCRDLEAHVESIFNTKGKSRK